MQANFVFEDGKGVIYMLLSPHRGHQPRIARFSSRSAGPKTTSRVVAIITTKEGCQVFDKHQRRNKDGKLTVTPKADKIAEYAGKQTKTRFVASLPTDKVASELTKQGQTYTWNNQASNGKDKTSTVKYHTDKPVTPAKPTTPAAKSTVTKVVKMAQTGYHQTWFDRLVAWFK